MPTPAEKLQKMFKEWFKSFSKTPYAVPAAVALSGGIFYLTTVYLSAVCLSNLIAPLFMLGILWAMGIKSIKQLLLIAAIACLFFSAILTTFYVGQFQSAIPKQALSEDGKIMVGSVDPFTGGKNTEFTYTLSISFDNTTETVYDANLLISSPGFPSASDHNYTMDLVSHNVDDSANTSNYTYSFTTTLPKSINYFVFVANISGNWTIAGSWDSLGRVGFIEGPMSQDSWAVAAEVLPFAIYSTYFFVFVPFAIILMMVWWTRRARKMRERQLEKWEQERARTEAEKPKSERKVAKAPSLETAMGKEETFVCSECGADVPADATVCPKCGEKFE